MWLTVVVVTLLLATIFVGIGLGIKSHKDYHSKNPDDCKIEKMILSLEKEMARLHRVIDIYKAKGKNYLKHQILLEKCKEKIVKLNAKKKSSPL